MKKKSALVCPPKRSRETSLLNRQAGQYPRIARALKVRTRCNQTLATTAISPLGRVENGHEQTFLKSICRDIVQTGGYRLAWVGYAVADKNKSVHSIAQ
jgi:hypothetical protein